MDILFSVVICTYNRATLLARALASLAAQTLDPARFEVVVVDNGSSDNTAAVTARYATGRMAVHYVYEHRRGLAHARNSGWQSARGAYVAFTDDDCILPPGWLATAERIAQTQPEVFGGPYLAYFDISRPAWFKPAYGSSRPYDTARDLQPAEYLPGGNLFVHRCLAGEAYGFDPQLGMAGGALGYGEEVALVQQIRRRRPTARIHYDPALYVYHLVRPEKMALRWKARQSMVIGFYYYPVFLRNRLPPHSRGRAMLLTLLRLLALLIEGGVALLLRNRRRYPHFAGYLWERGFRHLEAAGTAYARTVLSGS